MPQKHLVQVKLREKLNFHDFYFQLRGAGYEDSTMINSEIFYCIKISSVLSKTMNYWYFTVATRVKSIDKNGFLLIDN